jgi:hypothetical protein
MTLEKKKDSDNIHHKLTPVERYILKWAKQRPYQPFCFFYFIKKYSHGTIRNAFSGLKKLGLIKFYFRSSCTFYVLSSSKIINLRKPMTTTHTGGKHDLNKITVDFGSLLDSLEWEDVCRVHNVNFSFKVDGLYEFYLKEKNFSINKRSKDIQLPENTWFNGRTLKTVLHHNGKVTIYLKCSRCPITVTIEGLVSLASFLGGIRERLFGSCASSKIEITLNEIPKVEDWLVVQWHYGRDGKCEFSGPTLNVTFRSWCASLARIYLKNIDNKLRGRLEIVEEPKKKLTKIFEERINPNFFLNSTNPEKIPNKRSGERLASA